MFAKQYETIVEGQRLLSTEQSWKLSDVQIVRDTLVSSLCLCLCVLRVVCCCGGGKEGGEGGRQIEPSGS